MGGALSKIMGVKKPKEVKMKPPAEVQKEEPPMPDEVDTRRQAAIAAAKQPKTGRASTILSDYESLG